MYQITNIETGEVGIGTLAEAAETALIDQLDIEWAINEHGVCTTESHEIIEFPVTSGAQELAAPASGGGDKPSGYGDANDAGDADFKEPLRVRVFATQAAFDAWILKNPAAVLRLSWKESIVREAVEADIRAVASQLCPDEADDCAERKVEPSGVFLVTREMIALIR